MGGPDAGGVGGDPGEVDASRVDLDEEQDVEPSQGDGVDAAEVGGDHRLGLGADERRPCRAGAARGGFDPGAAEDFPHAGRRDPISQPAQLAVHPAVSPRRVLTGHPDCQSADLGDHRWSAGSRGLCPVAGHEPAVPAHHSLRLHDQQDLAKPGPVEDGRQQRQDRAVGLGEPRPGKLALQHQHLVTQRQNLGVAVVTGGEQPTETTQQEPSDRRDQVHEPANVPSGRLGPPANLAPLAPQLAFPQLTGSDEFSAPSSRCGRGGRSPRTPGAPRCSSS